MSWRRVGAVFLVMGALLVAVLSLGVGNVPSGIVDPAIEFYTKTHGADYAGIDRWAVYGMKAEPLVALLKKDGYVCVQPQAAVAGDKLNGIHEIICNKEVRWPLARTLSIRASIDYDKRGRLVAADARSAMAGGDQSVSRRIADFLRERRWIEPEKLQVKGFEVDSIDTLTRLAVDALAVGNLRRDCEEDRSAPACAEYARTRHASGFPPLPQTAIAVGDALTIHSAMERVRLLPLSPRGADNKPDDSLIVRVADEHMWLDFVGQDLSGHKLEVSVALASEGGAPVQLVAQLGAQSKTVALAGRHRLTNNGATRYLVPEAGDRNRTTGIWLDMPNESLPLTFKRLADVLPGIDAAFLPSTVKAVVASLVVARRPDEQLKLYPALRTIDHRANILRLAHAERWLPKDQGNRFIKQAFQDDPSTRAAWALAMCESAANPPVLDANCWQQFTAADPEVTALLRGEVTALQTLYAELEPRHPLRLRLKRLSDALPPSWLGTENLETNKDDGRERKKP